MIQALLRKVLADIGSHKLQYGLIFTMLALATMILTIALAVQRSADAPWDRTFEATNGPHVWLVSSHYEVDLSPVEAHEAVAESSGPIPALDSHPLVLAGEKYDIFLYGMAERPAVAHPLVAAGRWLDSAGLDEIVLDFSLATYFDLGVGDTVHILTAAGERPLQVVGLAVTAHWVPYDDNTRDLAPGVAYILPETLAEIEPDPAHRLKVIGLRLREPGESRDFVKMAHVLLDNQLLTSLEWQLLRELATFGNRINVLFLSFFSFLGLVAVGFIIANNIGGQVLAQYREIGLLKAIGFRPGQVTLLFVLEHLVVGLPAAVVGLLLGTIAAPVFTSPIAHLLNTPPAAFSDPWLLLTIFATIEGAVVLFTLVPAWHGGRIDTVQAISVGFAQTYRSASRLGRLAAWFRLPPVIVLGIKDVFARPWRTAITIVGLLLTIQVAIFAVGARATLANLAENRVYFQGTPADIRLARHFVPDSDVRTLLSDQEEVTGYYSEMVFYGWAAGHTDTPVVGRALDDAYDSFDFFVQEGRFFSAPGEAVAAAGLMQMLGAEIGDEITLLVGGRPLVVTIVGRHMEINNVGRVLLTSLETYQEQIDPAARPGIYGLALAPGSDSAALQEKLRRAGGGQFTIQVTPTEPHASAMQLQQIVVSLALLLLVVAAVNLLSATLLSVRERVRDFGIQKTLGMTPAQIAAGVATAVSTVALLAVLAGIPLGWLGYNLFMTAVSREIGAGAGFAQMNGRLLLLLLPGAVAVAILSSALPARQAAGIEVADALRYE
jgi:putative ABC transport system permease protein